VFNSSGIEDGTSGSWAAHAGSHSMAGAKSVAVKDWSHMAFKRRHPFDEKFQLKDEQTGALLSHTAYRIENSKGEVLAKGYTDAKGHTRRVHTTTAESLIVKLDHE
jgi:uncharacterized protein (DUF2345 family)